VSIEKYGRASLSRALRVATDVAIEVGLLLKRYVEDPELMMVRDRADLEAEQLIRESLMSAFPTWGFRAEEEPELNEMTVPGLPFWLVDPNDGTSAFLKGERGASISIALISNGQPVLGVVYAYAAPNGFGDLFTWAEEVSPLTRNGQEVKVSWAKRWGEATIFVSNSADRIAAAYQDVLAVEGEQGCQYRVAPGVAYRLALCAVGEGEVAISLASPRDFDFAAGHALLKGAGGDLLDEHGRSVTYLHHKPARLGLAFGGDRILARYAVTLDWTPTFLAQKTPISTPFLKPQLVDLCRDKVRLNALQGAWWGWHWGYRVSQNKIDSSEDTLRESIRQRGGDYTLVIEARSLCLGERSYEDLPRLQSFVQSLKRDTGSVADSKEPLTQEDGAVWGAQIGRTGLSPHIISSFLGWRGGEISHWQPDGDRLAEQLFSVIPALTTLLTSEK
jgi:fructose-1,6-bisphosphatase/inositol monophosphatase family enzyme